MKSRREGSNPAPVDFDVYLNDRRALIDASLEWHLKESKRRPERLYDAMAYSVFSGGKRIRPILTLGVGDLFGAEQNVLLPFACAIELIHTYSLIHDDLPALDDDDMRRGRLANHKLFGEGLALLAGDALLTEAFDLMARPQVAQSLDSDLVLNLIYEISRAAGVGGLVGGQVVDLEAENQKEVDLATVEYIHVRKTGALFLTAARVGARIGGATPEEMHRISRYAEFLGLAFQITDDLLDAGAEPDQTDRGATGKKEKSKATYPSIAGIAAARSRARELLGNCLKEIELFGKRAEPLEGIARYVVERDH